MVCCQHRPCSSGVLVLLSQALDKLQPEWEAASLNILDYRDTGTYVLKVCAGLAALLRRGDLRLNPAGPEACLCLSDCVFVAAA